MDIRLLLGTIPILAILLGGCGPSPELPDEHAQTEPGPGRVVIRMLDDMTFDPPHAVAAPGDTVVWVNAGGLPHTATADPRLARDPSRVVLPAGAEAWDSGSLEPRGEYRQVLTAPGTYAYVCTLHEMAGMAGTIDVSS